MGAVSMCYKSIAIIGMAFRFPGDIHDEAGMWEMLARGRCGITRIPADRWPVEELQHPDRSEPGRSVTFSAGVLSHIEQFDAAFFGISPREAAWLDPQQRLLLELAHESMEDAGLPPTSLAGSRCGVYVGISGMDYGQHALEDLASMSGHTMTGNTLSIAANRISYFFDLHGPSLAIDTACSSSLAALHHACQALRSGEVPVALSGGINLLMHPYSFIGFSKASMLSATGRCRPFDAAADGYVRAEGGALLLLKPLERAQEDGDHVHAVILASGVNADGARKPGLTIPSAAAQAELMRNVLAQSGLGPADVDFIEAHGTGTPVGDPVEAAAIGLVYGQGRERCMPVSSVKANLGHLEPASGMAGLVKAVLALKHGELPPMPLDFAPNPGIDFSELHVQCPASGMPLRRDDRAWLAAGVNSFGFGGVNAHVVLRGADLPPPVENPPAAAAPPLLLSARSEEALRDLAGAYAACLEGADLDHYYDIAYCAAFHRDRLEKRLAVFEENPAAVAPSLRAFAKGENPHEVLQESALPEEGGTAFIYSGNGSQWLGMARALYASSPVFADLVTGLDREMQPLLGRSLAASLLEDDPDIMADTSISQPLLFAVQAGVTILLRDMGITPRAVAGHSVGEVAAAWAAGALTLQQAVQVICARSHAQGSTRGAGRMAAVALPAHEAEELILQADLAGRVEIAGINSPRNVTLSGDLDGLRHMEERIRPRNIFFRLMNLEYAFHSRHMDGIRGMLTRKLDGLAPSSDSAAAFVSTVTGQALAGGELGSEYWWKNVRRPVQFAAAVERLASLGCRIFVEIGPHAVLQRYIRENLAVVGVKGRILPSLLRGDDGMPRIRGLAARLHALTPDANLGAIFPHKGRRVSLPLYPWQRRGCLYPRTSECQPDKRRIHPLLGWPLECAEPTWENMFDPAKDIWLTDHKVGQAIVFPGAAYVEIALAAARFQEGEAHPALESLDIALPLVFENGQARCVRCVLHPADGSFRILSRPRLGSGEWGTHAAGRIVTATGREPGVAMPALSGGCREMDGETLYALAARLGLDYGPTFRVIERIRMHGDRLDAVLHPVGATEYVLPPAALDACFHALAALYAGRDHMPQTAFLPVKTGRLDRYAEGAVAYIRARVQRMGRRSMSADFDLLDAQERLVARASGCRFRAVPTAYGARERVRAWRVQSWLSPLSDPCDTASTGPLEALARCAAEANAADAPQRALWFKGVLPLMEVMVLASALRAFHGIAGEDSRWTGHLTGPYARWLARLLRQEGLLAEQGGQWRLAPADELPQAEELWREAFRQWPQCLPALLPVGRVSRRLPEMLRGHADGATLREEICNAPVTRESLRANPFRQGMDAALQAIVAHLARRWPAHRRLRIMEVAAAPTGLTETLDAQLPPDRFEHALALWDAKALSHAGSRHAEHPSVKLLPFDAVQWRWEAASAQGPFDLIVLNHSLHRAAHLMDALGRLREMLAPGGLLLASERHPDWSADFVEGLDPSWWHEEAAAHDGTPMSSLLRPEAWARIFEEQGFASCLTYAEPAAEGLNEGSYLLLAGHAPEPAGVAAEIPPASWLLLTDDASRQLAAALCGRLEARGQRVRCIYDDALPAAHADHVIFLRGAGDTPLSVVPTLDALLGCARDCAAREPVAPRLWIVTCGGALGTDLPEGYAPRPAQCAVAGLGRVIMNEYDRLSCALLDVPAWGDCPDLALRLEKEFLEPDGTDEILLTSQARYTLRLGELPSCRAVAPADPEARCRLDFAMPGRLGNLAWQADTAQPLANGEVEARVMATGLNFRDVMLVMGLVPDDAVENGFAGATLGLEFSGIVTRVGQGARGLDVGDKVVGFAPACFASHVVTPAHTLVRLPDGWSHEAAAATPTVFFTAWYALKHLAQLQPGESVLIHGAAGGVGLAAIRIARHLGAKIFATAGSEEKRDLLRLLGVEHIFDSRSLSFADDVLAATNGQGVDAVLNSLAGEAMRRSIGLLKPFGRFLELGKRDFVENTALGLRPFKENISYFAMDADQLLTARPALAAALFQEVTALLRDGTLTSLPYRAFPAAQVVAAFRTMQQAQHMGKIVVSLRDLPSLPAACAPLGSVQLDGESTWLVTGGLSGFGLVTARHLAQCGVKHLVLAGRRGAGTPEAARILEEFRKLGVNARAEACDMAEAGAVRSLIAGIAATMPPLRGILHAAAVFDDRFLADLDTQSLEAVLAPKLSGAWHLHEATLHLPLTHFILYSSISVALGNPGQGNYVAANAGLEGLTRLRLHMGLPASCIAWGPVGDAGYLTRHEAVKKSLTQRLGRPPLTSAEAMRQLDDILATGGLRILADVDWGVVCGTPPARASRFEFVARRAAQGGGAGSSRSVQEELAGKSPEEAKSILRALIVEEVAQVLGLGVEQVPPDRSVQSLGLDSLMAVELAVGLEQRVGVRLPAMMLQDSPTVEQIAERITARLSGTAGDEKADVAMLAELARRHAEELSEDEVSGIIHDSAVGEGEK